MFRRSEKPAEEPVVVKEGGKGRPTPSRKEAEAAAKARARTPMDKKSAQKVLRDQRTESNKRMREGMKAGEEKYLPPRDQGPIRRFVREWVDARVTFTEFLLPLLIVIWVLSVAGNSGDADNPSMAMKISSYLWSASILLLLVDVIYVRVRLGKALRTKFPEENTKGNNFYAFIRILQIRPMRIPKTGVKIGQKLDLTPVTLPGS